MGVILYFRWSVLRMLKATRQSKELCVCEGREKDVPLDLKPVLLNSSVHWPEEPGVSHALCLKKSEQCFMPLRAPFGCLINDACLLLAALLQASYFNGQWQPSAEESWECDIRGRGERPSAVHDSQWRTDAAWIEGIKFYTRKPIDVHGHTGS